MEVGFKKFELVLVNLDPSVGAEIKKKRPCLIISPDEINRVLQTVIVAPLTSTSPRTLPTRVLIRANGHSELLNDSYAVLDQIKTVDKRRIFGTLGMISDGERRAVTEVLEEMFEY